MNLKLCTQKTLHQILFIALILAFSITLTSCSYKLPKSNREVSILNSQWNYYRGDSNDNPESPSYEDSKWEKVNIPHCFNIPYWMENINFGGVGWYRKEFTVEPSSRSKRIFVEFEGAFQHTWVYINGSLIGQHKGGYTGFNFDITNYVNFGQKNTIAVKISSDWNPQIAPLAGDYVFIGGLYRDVYLVTTDQLHVTWYGTFVTTPFGGELTDVNYSLPTSYDSAPVNVKTEIKNAGSKAKYCRVKTIIADAKNMVVAKTDTAETIDKGAIHEFSQDFIIDKPHFWSPDDPYLYTVYTEVYDRDKLVDTYKSPLGIRWFQATAHEGFWLNGKRTVLRGFNVHQDHAGWGYAVTNSGFYRDMKLMKDTGANFIRGSHYPKDPALLDACDKFGLCMMQEVPYWGKGGGPGPAASPDINSPDFAPFQENVEQQLTQMIRTSRNNPSVIMWSLLNETTYGQLSTTPLNELAHKLDPTRPTCRVTSFSEGKADIYGQNGFYPRRSDKYPVIFAELWEKEEYRPGTYVAKPDPDAYYSLGTAKWAGFDYGTWIDWGRFLKDKRELNLVGACDNYRIPKRKYYWYRNCWLNIDPPQFPEPGTPAKLQLTTDKTLVGNDGTDDCHLIVEVQDANGTHISNEITVTLEIVSGPGQFPTGSTIDLNTPDGLAGIEFRSYEAGATIIKAVSNSIESEPVEIKFVDGGIQQPLKPIEWPEQLMPKRPTGTNVALNKEAKASTAEKQNTANKAVDGDLSTKWCASGPELGQWWQVDLGKNYDIHAVGLTLEQFANYQFMIDVSKDGSEWTTVADHSEKTSYAKERFIYFNANARYVRITYISLAEGLWAGHFDVQIFSNLGK